MNKYLLLLLILLIGMAQTTRAEVEVDTETLQLNFSDYGDLISIHACLPVCSDPDARTQDFDSYRGFLSLNRDSGVVFKLDRVDGDKSVQLVFSNRFTNEVRQWSIPHSGWLIGFEVSRSQNMAIASGEAFERPNVAGFGAWLESLRYVVFDQGGLQQSGLGEDLEPWQQEQAWLGYRSRYWAALIRPEQAVSAALRTGENQFEAQLDLSPVDAGPSRYLVYAGPVEPAALRSAHPELEGLMYSGLWFWLRWICQALFMLLAAIQSLVLNWALAIILMSLLVQLIIWPLNRLAERIQDDVRDTESRISPRLNKIKEGYKGAEQAERILALYKEEKVHPLYSMKSLAGVLVIIPVFIGAFNMLSENIWLSGESFLWIRDLSLPDAIAKLPFALPFLGNNLNLLPFIMIALSVPASILRNAKDTDSSLRARNTRNLCLMSLLFFMLFYTFPAGMVLYWVVNNAISLITSITHRVRA